MTSPRAGGLSPRPNEVPQREFDHIDKILDDLDDAMETLFKNANSAVKLRSSEINLLKHFEESRNFMDDWMRKTAHDRHRLEAIFGLDGCIRISRIRAALENVELSEMNRKDQRLLLCTSSCQSVVQVLEDLGYANRLKEAQDALLSGASKGVSKWKAAKEAVGGHFNQPHMKAAKALSILSANKLPLRSPRTTVAEILKSGASPRSAQLADGPPADGPPADPPDKPPPDGKGSGVDPVGEGPESGGGGGGGSFRPEGKTVLMVFEVPCGDDGNVSDLKLSHSSGSIEPKCILRVGDDGVNKMNIQKLSDMELQSIRQALPQA